MKKIIALLLTFAFVMSMTAMTAYAETVKNPSKLDSVVSLDVDSVYYVEIPSTVELTQAENYTKTADIAISDVFIASDKTVQVKINSDFTMTAENDNGTTTDLAYTVTDENMQEVANEAVVATCTTDKGSSTSALTFSAEPEYAGSYSDTVIFNIALV